MTRRIFISYSRDNQEVVKALHADLSSAGLDAFFDSELTGGQSWWDSLLEEIRRCEIFMPVVTEDWMGSHACRLETDYAFDLGRTVLPVTLDESTLKLMPSRLVTTQSVPYSGEEGKSSILGIMRAVNTLPAAVALPDPLPAAPSVPMSYLTKLRDKVYVVQELNRDEQRLILAEFRRRISEEEEDVKDLHKLLGVFSEREDLYAQTAREISALLALAARQDVSSTADVVIGDLSPPRPAARPPDPPAASTRSEPPPPTTAQDLAPNQSESPAAPAPGVATAADPAGRMLTWSYVCSAGAVVLSLLQLSYVLGPVAIILAYLARKQGSPNGDRAWKIAWICTVVGISISLLIVVVASMSEDAATFSMAWAGQPSAISTARM